MGCGTGDEKCQSSMEYGFLTEPTLRKKLPCVDMRGFFFSYVLSCLDWRYWSTVPKGGGTRIRWLFFLFWILDFGTALSNLGVIGCRISMLDTVGMVGFRAVLVFCFLQFYDTKDRWTLAFSSPSRLYVPRRFLSLSIGLEQENIRFWFFSPVFQ